MLKNFLFSSDMSLEKGSAKRLKEIVDALRRYELLHGVTPKKIRLLLEDLGPTFVKLGQIMSMRPDFLPKEYCQELTKLQSNVNPMPFEEVKDIVQRELGCRWNNVFVSIEAEALGSASIAQVHKAVLHSGEQVVIKVQRRGIYELMVKDIALLKRAVGLMNIVRDEGVLDFQSVINEMWEIAKQEMDFHIEADHIEEFQRCNKAEQFVSCPSIYRELSTARVLVMEYVDGIPLDDAETLRNNGVDMVRIGKMLGTNYVKQIIEDGFFHADPHPGNIWVHKGRIVWLDLGMMGRLSNQDKASFRKAILALVSHDTYSLKEAVLALGNPQGRIDHIRLYEDIDLLLNQYGDLDFEHLEMGKLARQILSVLKKNDIAVPNGFSMFVRGVIIMESVMSRCCPQTNFSEIFVESLKLNYQKNFSWVDELSKLKRESRILVHKSMQLPEQISDILKMTLSGQTKVNLDLTGSEEPLRRMDKMINKMAMAIISAALLLGSSTICTTQMTPKIMEIPLLGVFGYMAAIILGGKLMWSIIKGDRRN